MTRESTYARARREALAALEGVPDWSLPLLVWQVDDHENPLRPLARDEIRAGLFDGTIDPGSIVRMASFATATVDEIDDLVARQRRQQLRAL